MQLHCKISHNVLNFEKFDQEKLELLSDM